MADIRFVEIHTKYLNLRILKEQWFRSSDVACLCLALKNADYYPQL
jgi:hypothetical protein